MEKFREIRRFPRFHGGFHTWRSTIFVDQENRSKVDFLVFSSGKREAVKRYLWLKLLWNSLSKIEFELFLSLLSDSDYKEWSYLKLSLQIPKKKLRVRIIIAELFLGDTEISWRKSYIGSLRIRIEIQKEIRKLPKTKKFSGYIKSLSARGKSSNGRSGIEPDLTSPYDYVEKIDQESIWWAFLSKPSLNDTSEQESINFQPEED